MDVQLVMFNDDAEVTCLLTLQLVAYNFGPNKFGPILYGFGDL